MSDRTASRTTVLPRKQEPLASAARVSILVGKDAGAVVDVALPTSIGRAAVAGVRLHDPAVSAVHLDIAADPSGFAVHDLGSTNGTAASGGVLLRDAVLPSGAELHVGTTVLRVDLVGSTVPPPELAEFGRLRSANAEMRALFAQLAHVAKLDVAVLVEAQDIEEADGIARALQEAGVRANEAFVTLDCASWQAGLEGAIADAKGGTLYLRGIDALAPSTQRFLTDAQLECALLSSSSRELPIMVNAGAFDEDLYDRVAAVRVRVPPLARRREDIHALVYRALQSLSPEGRAAHAISRDAMADLRRRDWPGGARELVDVVTRAAMIAPSGTITPADLSFQRALDRVRYDIHAPFKHAKQTVVDDFERTYLAALLERSGGKVSRAAEASGVDRHHLTLLLRKHGLRA